MKLYPVLLSCILASAATFTHAAELPVFTLEAKDGVFTPTEIRVPANTKIKIEIKNTGKSAIEFESHDLKKEKVLAPGATSFIVIQKLKPGSYRFFDEFHEATGKGTIIAK